jgi:hypothetical protein
MDASQSTLMWRKASASKSNGSCVELAPLSNGGVAVRDSKNPEGPMLRFTPAEWSAFAHGWTTGEFDDLIGR